VGRRARSRRGAFGLQGRIVGAVLVTTVATLAVAAVALLGPLENSLRNAELKTLKTEIGIKKTAIEKTIRPFQTLDLGSMSDRNVTPPATSGRGNGSTSGGAAVGPNPTRAIKEEQKLAQQGQSVHNKVVDREKTLEFATSATKVALLGYPDVSGHNAQPLVVTPDTASARADPYDDVAKAFNTGRPNYTFGSIGDTQYVRAAIPFTTRGVDKGHPEHWVLAVRKSLDTLSDAVSTVRRAFLYAALAGLVLTLILGIPLSATIVRRLRRLREAAIELAHDGPPVEVPAVRARDEVGDLARAFEQMQHRLQQQEEARRAFVSTASHELRTPLASLDGMLELLDDDLGSGHPDLDDARSLLERARTQSRRLSRLAADLLDLSRLDAQVQLRSEPVELGELSRAVLAEFELGTDERGIISTLDDAAGQVWARGDPGGIARIVRILLDNAVRVSPQGGEITVELRNGDHATLTVRDEGPGVPPDERDLIFERFQRGRGAGGTAGFGLGLAIGRELADRMGGELMLEHSDVPGAKFILRLPVAQAQEEEPLAMV
jgi:signal transduction histidine kinase